MDIALLRRGSNLFLSLEMPFNRTQYRRPLGGFNNRNFSFNYNKMTISCAVLNKEHFSTLNNI